MKKYLLLSFLMTSFMFTTGCEEKVSTSVDARADSASVAIGESVVISVLSNDISISDSSPSLMVNQISDGSFGTTVINTDNTISYTPNADVDTAQTDTFTYRAYDTITEKSDVATVTVSIFLTEEEINLHAPVADAGEDKTVDVDKDIEITGTGTDQNGSIVSYEWKEGATVLANTATFTYSSSENVVHALTLTVTDNQGATASDEMSVTVTSVTEINLHAPVADAGEDKTVDVDESIQIVGTGSDQNGSIVSYVWKEGATVLANTASFDYNTSVNTIHTLTLTVTDNQGATASDEMTVTVTNHRPMAHTQSVSVGTATSIAITLTSEDEDGDALTYAVSTENGPNHGTVTGTAPNLTYTPDPEYVSEGTISDAFTFTVNDGYIDSFIATISIIINAHPTAIIRNYPLDNVELLYTAIGVKTQDLNSTGSSDADGVIVKCQWFDNEMTLVVETNSSECALMGLMFDTTGTYEYTLKVTDDDGAIDTETINIQVNDNNVPMLNMDENATEEVNSSILHVAIITDNDDEHVTYWWVYGLKDSLETNETDHDTLNNAIGGVEVGIDYAFPTVGIYTLTLHAQDQKGAEATQSVEVNVTEATEVSPVGTVIAGDLMWEDIAHTRNVTLNWTDADTYCTDLVYVSFSNWRLPTVLELKSTRLGASDINGDTWNTDNSVAVDDESRTINEPFFLIKHGDNIATWTNQDAGSGTGHFAIIYSYDIDNIDVSEDTDNSNITVRCVRDN